MKEGYYWIQHVGVVQVAYYTNDTVDDLESGQVILRHMPALLRSTMIQSREP